MIGPLGLASYWLTLTSWLTHFLIYFSHVAQYLFQWSSLHPAALVVWAGVGGINFLLPRILLLSLHHFHFLSGFPTYTSCLANQRLFKTWLTEYRQFSRTRYTLLINIFTSVYRHVAVAYWLKCQHVYLRQQLHGISLILPFLFPSAGELSVFCQSCFK